MDELVYLERRRPADFYVNYSNGLKTLTFKWNGFVEGRKIDVKAVPMEVFSELNSQGTTISDGELVVSDQQVNKEEVLSQIIDVEELLENVQSRDEIVEMLSGNINKMKANLKKVTVQAQKSFIKEVADSIEDTLTGAKINYIKEWYAGKVEE